ncbi:glycosyltransferase [Candidatus Fermentibacteria bacterium]|nr:glycosyltransferase [Candidatus Fermentibacteria bacterium]
MNDSGEPKLAVVVPARNAAELLPGLLRSLEESTYQNWEAFLADDQSTDSTPRIMTLWCARTRRGHSIRLSTRRGPPGARNAALRAALASGHSLVVFHDVDCLIHPTTLAAHATAHTAHPMAGIVGGPVRSIHTTRIGAADGYASWFTSPPGRPDGRVRFLHLPTCNMSVKAWVFEKTGLFREDLATGEDVAFCQEARRCGIELRFASDAVVEHKDRDDLSSALDHHRRWGAHTHDVRQGEHAFLGTLVPRNPRICRMLGVPYAFAFTLLVLGLWIRYDPRVLLAAHRIYRMKRAFSRGLVDGARRTMENRSEL